MTAPSFLPPKHPCLDHRLQFQKRISGPPQTNHLPLLEIWRYIKHNLHVKTCNNKIKAKKIYLKIQYRLSKLSDHFLSPYIAKACVAIVNSALPANRFSIQYNTEKDNIVFYKVFYIILSPPVFDALCIILQFLFTFIQIVNNLLYLEHIGIMHT